ncbi:PAS domain-containing protein, partial [Candidatus Sumerlaeota bacterium]|nr:PAS domain-containing protein [Candidatus Sumerlaeota bacterium]
REDASREYGKICGVGSFNDMTELTRAQEELLALKQRLEFILGATRTGLDIIDSNFNMVYIDPEWAKTYGDPQGRKCYEYFMGRGEVCPGCGIAKALRTKQPVVTEEILARENNRPVQVTTIPFQNEKGEWLVAEVNADITERKRAEEHIRKLNEVQAALHDPGALREKLKRITDGVVDIFDADFARIWLTRPGDLCESGCMHAEVTEGPHVCRSRDRCLHLLASSGRYTHLDGKGHRRVPFGCYKIGRIASGQDAAFLTNDVAGDPRVHNHEWARALGLVSFAGYQLRPPHGETIGVLALFSKRPISSEEDALLKSLSNLIVPVIQATQADDALRKSEHTYRTLLENLPQKIFLKDANSVYVSCNENYARDLGINADEIAGKTDYDFHPVELAEKYRADDKRTMELGNPEELEEPYVQDGQRKWVHTLKTPVRDESGKVMGILGIFWDITEKKNLEEQLRQAQKMEAVGRLAGGVAHDFNNLLTVIGGNAELAAMTPLLPEEAGRHLTGIMQASERAADLTRQLLAFSRRQTLAPRVVSLNDVLSNMDKMLRRLIGEDIELVTLLAKDLWAVRVDISQMEQVIANLAVNARDAMPHGGKLTLETANAHLDAEYARLYPDATPGEYVMLAIRDTGCGMTHEVKAHIFEPFFTTKEVGKGTGLGLSTCYG